uniref:Uncharacterized protein n=1 Tax=Iridovirus sp. TaxID=135728 RepID=A0AAU7YBD1_9VIRU
MVLYFLSRFHFFHNHSVVLQFRIHILILNIVDCFSYNHSTYHLI